MQLFARKPIADLQPVEGPHALKRVLGAGDLVMLAIGAVIGAGIFSSIGTAAAGEIRPDGTIVRAAAGPALILSFMLLGVVCGLGFALTEEVLFDGGKITTTNFGEFKIPSIADIPALKTAVMENVPAGPGPYNSLAIGEVANVPTAAAVANAVADACGVRITDLPVTSEKVYKALCARSAL